MHQDLERALAYELRKYTGQTTKAKLHTCRAPSHTVTLSVRGQHGGLPFRFERCVTTVSALDAEIQAKKTARAQGLTIWAVIDVQPDTD